MSFVTREQVEETRAWIRAFYEACDSFDVDYWINEFFEPDAIVHLGNRPIITGHDDLLLHFEQQYSLLTGMRHTIRRIDVLPERSYVHVETTVIIKEDPEQRLITLKELVVIGKNIDDNRLTFLHAYVDPTPLLNTVQIYI